ncbi:MAG: hypothetical protein ACI4J2_06885 [Ruminococcus sp.]
MQSNHWHIYSPFISSVKYVADTIVGPFGLVTVSPLTAVTSGFLMIRKKKY